MEDDYYPCPNCEGRGWVILGWEFAERTTEEIMIASDKREACEGCRTSKWPGYVYMPPAVDKDNKPHYNKYARDHQSRAY